jgi:hypothetical protein
MPSFDVVSEIDSHELTNAVDQASRELSQRFDFKNTGASFELEETTVTMRAPSEFQLNQMLEILKLKVAKRGIDVVCLDVQDPMVNLAVAKQQVILKHGIDQETGKKVTRLLKDSDPRRKSPRDREKARRPPGRDRPLAQGRLRGAPAVQQFSGVRRRRAARRDHCFPDGGAFCIPLEYTTVPSSLTMMASMSSSRL